MIKLYKSDDHASLKEREYVDDVYTVVSKESMNMEDDLRGIYVDDSLDALEDELSAEGFEYYDEGICIAPADCLYRIWKNDKYKIFIYFGNDDNIVYNIYVKEKDTTLESVCSRKRKLREQDVEIEVKHEGILEVPEGKNVEDLPIKHFVDLAKKKGLSKITKALNNLQVWNKKKNPSLSKWAGDMIDKVSKKMEKNEAFDRYNPNIEADFMEPGNLYNDMPDTENTQDDVFEFYVSYCMNNCRNENIAREYLESENLPDSFIDSIIDEIYRRFDISESFSNGRTIRESAAEKDLYDDLYSYADQYRMTSRWTKTNVEKYLERQKNFRRMSDVDFQKVVDKVNKDFKRKKKVKSFPYDSNSYKTESIRRKRIKEDSWDDFVKPNIEKRYIWPLYEDSAYEISEIIEKYQNTNRFKNEIKSFDLKDISYMDWPALQLEIECSYEVYVLIRKDIEREGLYVDDDEFDESLN